MATYGLNSQVFCDILPCMLCLDLLCLKCQRTLDINPLAREQFLA